TRRSSLSMVSCSASAASSGSPHRRRASVYTGRSNQRYSCSNAAASPRRARASSASGTSMANAERGAAPPRASAAGTAGAKARQLAGANGGVGALIRPSGCRSRRKRRSLPPAVRGRGRPYTGPVDRAIRPAKSAGGESMFSSGFLAVVLLVAGVILLAKTVRMVPQGYEWTVERFGKYTHTLTPGLHFLVPVVYSVGRKVNMMEQVLDVPSQDVITKDNAVVKVDGVVFFQVLDAARAAYEVANLEVAMIALVQTNIRTVIGSMDLDESLSQREAINAQLLGVVDHATNPWGV